MDLSRHFIFLDGEPRTLSIETISRDGANGYAVCFKNSRRVYHYGLHKVTWLSGPERLDLSHGRVFVDGVPRNNVREVLRFSYAKGYCWRLTYDSGFVQDYADGHVRVALSCLDEQKSKDIFEYLKQVAAVNSLGQAESACGILSGMYADIDFVDDQTAAACYLDPVRHRPACLHHAELLFPFGCNASQKRAASRAFERQVSVIQGPPGTGKTQTILNIIANVVSQGKTVMVVSNNNTATANVREKLEQYGVGFLVASLGRRENKETFVANQPAVPAECRSWTMTASERESDERELQATSQQLEKVYSLESERAILRQERQSVALEWKHFRSEQMPPDMPPIQHRVGSKRLMSIWLRSQMLSAVVEETTSSFFQRLKGKLLWWWMKVMCKYWLHLKSELSKDGQSTLTMELQALYYQTRLDELNCRIEEIDEALVSSDAKHLAEHLTEVSMRLFKAHLADYYTMHPRPVFADTSDLRRRGKEVMSQYPVVLSTTFSARSCLFSDMPYDYVIMDEASQVSVETGALALTCARNAVIVGDTRQLPNVVADEERDRLEAIAGQMAVAEGYDSANNSFLQSVLAVMNDVPQTLLREHYRCHPRIINFCNQKFYDGELLIMTDDEDEENVLTAVRTVAGNHAVDNYNQREIDVIKREVLPTVEGSDSIGIVTPYNNQVEALTRQIPSAKVGTVHKYQGRECDVIIMSVVDNQITPFADDAHMLNVAVSRAKKKFCLVVTGNHQEHDGNITDLLDYIAYNNCTITDSKLSSIFDYLYGQYTEQRMVFLRNHPHISEFASENLTYAMLTDVLASDTRYGCLEVLCHVPLRQVVRDTSLMSEEELTYASNYHTHLDFLIVNKVTKRPVMAIETDGYAYHNEKTEQHHRDEMKDHILACYGLPLLRLSTRGSGERVRVEEALRQRVR